MREKILNTRPEDLTSEECILFSSDEELEKEYVDKWKTKGICER